MLPFPCTLTKHHASLTFCFTVYRGPKKGQRPAPPVFNAGFSDAGSFDPLKNKKGSSEPFLAVTEATLLDANGHEHLNGYFPGHITSTHQGSATLPINSVVRRASSPLTQGCLLIRSASTMRRFHPYYRYRYSLEPDYSIGACSMLVKSFLCTFTYYLVSLVTFLSNLP